jgi:aconitate hydratase
MGVLPLQFAEGETAESLGLTGEELFDIEGIASGLAPGAPLKVKAGDKSFEVVTRIDTAVELDYYKHGGILQFVLRQLLA